VYSGEWRNHKYNGVGVYDYEDGDVYYGEFRNDKLHGFGVHSSKRAGVFSGEYRDHKANGVGVYDDKVGNVFSGEFRDSKLHGHAIFKAVVGEKTFEVWEFGEQKSSVPFDPNNNTHRDVEQRAQAAKVRALRASIVVERQSALCPPTFALLHLTTSFRAEEGYSAVR
jgi:hypothetical protein